MKYYSRFRRTFLKQVIAVIFALSIFISQCAGVFADSSSRYRLNTTINDDPAFLQKVSLSNEAYSRLLNTFKNNSDEKSQDLKTGYTVSGISSDAFPDYYCGAYINTDGNLVVLLNNNLTEDELSLAKVQIENQIGNYPLVYGYANIAYKTLVSMMTEIADVAEKRQYESIGITGFGIDDYNNQIIIYLCANNKESRQEINKQLSDSSFVHYVEKKSYDVETTINANYSEAITANGNAFSIGFRARRTTSSGSLVSGFITCGHAFSNNTSNYVVSYGGLQIGTMFSGMRAYENNGHTDAAFVQYYGNAAVNNVVTTATGYSYTVQPIYTDVAAGGYVFMYGEGSYNAGAAIRLGVVSQASYASTQNNDGINLYDMVLTTYTASSGDSGGVVFTHSSNMSSYIVAGTQSRMLDSNSSGIYAKASNTLSALGVYIY